MFRFVFRYSSVVIPIALMLLASGGCHRRQTTVGKVPPKNTSSKPNPEAAPPAITPAVVEPPKTAPLEPSPLPKTITTPSPFELGETDFRLGNYRQAAKSFEAFLSSNRESADRAEALYHLGLSRALIEEPGRDMRQAEDAFRRLIDEFPASPYKRQAEFILGMMNQIDKLKAEVRDKNDAIKRLSDELQKLKEIDLNRRPTRPQE